MTQDAETVAGGGTIPTPESAWMAPKAPESPFGSPADWLVRVLVTWKTKVPTEHMNTWHVPMVSSHVIRVSGVQHIDGDDRG